MITEAGRLLIDTAMFCSAPSTIGNTYPFAEASYKNTGFSGGECYISKDSFRYIPYMFFHFRSAGNNITLYYGEEIIDKEDTVITGIKKQSLPYSVICQINFDEENNRTVLGGTITNTSEEDKIIKYMGIHGVIGLSGTTSAAGNSKVISSCLLSYIELPNPITLKKGESYAFTITPDMMV